MAKKDKNKEEEKEPSAVEVILEMVEEQGVYFFHDQFNDAYAAINGDGTDLKKIRSSDFRRYLIQGYYDKTGRVTTEAIIKMLCNLFESRAMQSASHIDLYVRAARFGNVAWYDLGDGRAIGVHDGVWEIEEKPTILFRRFKHQIPQVTPEKGGSLDDFVELANVKTGKDKLLLKVYTVALFIAGFPHPVLTPHGDQGAAKSTLCKMLKQLVDPSAADLFEPPSKYGLNEFVQTASHHWVIFLDNISYLSNELSDLLCRICTGQGHSKRVLYSDDDDFVYSFQHCVGLNGINQVIKKPDLLNRSLLLQMEKITDSNRLELEDLWKRFNEIKPKTLGAIFDAVALALQYYPQVQLEGKPHMADFARWGCAIAKALGYTEKDFMDVYKENIKEQTEQALESDGIAQIIVQYVNDYMQDVEEKVHTPTELFALLHPISITLNVEKEFPKSATWLWRKIKPVGSDLAEKGIVVEKGKGEDRSISIKKLKKDIDNKSSEDDSSDTAAELPPENFDF